MNRYLPWFVAFWAAAAGCGDAAVVPDGRDALPDNLPESGRLVADFGVLDVPAAEVLGEVRDVALAAGGRAWILDRGRREVLLLDGGWNLASVIGGAGEGPGELYDPVAIEVLADPEVLVVVDRERAILQRFAAADDWREMERVRLPFRPSDACEVQGLLAITGFADSAAVHLIEPHSGEVTTSIAASSLQEMLRVPDPVRLAEAAEAAGGSLVCDDPGGRIVHVPAQLGWVRAHNVDGSLGWETRPDGFVEVVRVGSEQGGVRYDLDPAAGYASTITRAALATPQVLALHVEHGYARASGLPPRTETIFLSLDSGEEVGRVEGADPIVSAVDGLVATLQTSPFPTLELWAWPVGG